MTHDGEATSSTTSITRAEIERLSREKLSRDFYLRPTVTVAQELLGTFLCRRHTNRILIGRIVEVEAYLGETDPASHAYRGRTKRNDVMFWEGGHLYVYFTYGMHFCANIVTEPEGKGMAVLLRAVEPVDGVEVMIRNRFRVGGKANSASEGERLLLDLCRGPARLCQAFGITRNENGTDLCGPMIWIASGDKPPGRRGIARSARVGIWAGREHRWRFFLSGNPFVSAWRSAKR
jgi:DNA-3-methyladenine glycosylase